MKPITREEQYLNRLTGEEGIIPDKPVTREEQYFARLCGGDNVIPDKPVTRREQYLATLCGEDVITPTKPVTRIEQYMAFASGESESKPEKPITREEMYWDKYQGGDVPEEKTIPFTDIITVTDALARPAVDLQSEITATQNLNGYEYPWVGGAGKNKLDLADHYSITCPMGENGYADIKLNVSVKSGVTYTLSAIQKDNLTSATRLTLMIRGINGVNMYEDDLLDPQLTPHTHKIVFTPNSDQQVSFSLWYHTLSNACEMTDFQLELGSTATAYAPYENICPISGRTEVNVTRTGKNLLSSQTITKAGSTYYVGGGASDFPFFLKAGTYTMSNSGTAAYCYWRLQGTSLNNIIHTNNDRQGTFTLPQDGYYRFWFYTAEADASFTEIQIELGSTATAYEPYEGDTFNTELGRTVYGGTLDLTTGELKITHEYVDLGDMNWSKFADYNVFEATINDKKNGATNFTTTSYRTVEKAFTVLENGETTSTNRFPVPSIFIKDERVVTAADFKTLVTGQKMVYELAIPQTISLTPTEVMMLENNNTIWADSGRVQLTYLSKAAERVQLMNASLKANTLKLTKGAVKK